MGVPRELIWTVPTTLHSDNMPKLPSGQGFVCLVEFLQFIYHNISIKKRGMCEVIALRVSKSVYCISLVLLSSPQALAMLKRPLCRPTLQKEQKARKLVRLT